MKIGTRTAQILKNFATINPSLLFKPGSSLVTVSPNKTMMVKATVEESFPLQFAIYDLSRLLGVLSLFNEPELDFDTQHLNIKSGNQSVSYTYADVSMIEVPPNKTVELKTKEIKFTLTADHLSSIQRALGVLGLPEIAVVGDREKIYLTTSDTRNPTSDQYSIEVGETTHEFKIVFKSENIKLLSAAYEVEISSQGIGHFKTSDIEYWIVAESSSTFSE